MSAFNRKNFLITLCVFLLTRFFTMYCAFNSGCSFFDFHDYSRWDSGHYLSIAENGYVLKTCADEKVNPDPDNWCGNCGWMPFYSYLICGLKVIGLDAVMAGYLISALFQFGFLFLMFAVLLKGIFNLKNGLILLASGFFFGNIYYHAVFPVSMFLFFVILMMVFISDNKIMAASVAGAFASFTYSSGIWLAPVMALFLIVHYRKQWSYPLFKKIVAAVLIISSGFALVLLNQKIVTGKWNAFFLVQDKYGHGINIPTKYIKRNFLKLFDYSSSESYWITLQTNAVLLFMITIFIASVIRKQSAETRTLNFFVLIYGLIFYLAPLTMGSSLSIYRAESLLLPVVLLMSNFPRIISIVFILIFIVIAFHISPLFFMNVLV